MCFRDSVIALYVYKTNTQPVGITDRLMCVRQIITFSRLRMQ